MSDLRELAAAVVAAVRADDNAPMRKTAAGSILAAFRPYVEAELTGIAPKQLRDEADRRQKRWYVSFEFWTGSKLDVLAAESNGRQYSTTQEITRYGGDIVQGLDGAAELVEKYATELQAPLTTFGRVPMRQAFGYLRPTISRQSGYGVLRRKAPEGNWYLIAHVWREDVFPKEARQ